MLCDGMRARRIPRDELGASQSVWGRISPFLPHRAVHLAVLWNCTPTHGLWDQRVEEHAPPRATLTNPTSLDKAPSPIHQSLYELRFLWMVLNPARCRQLVTFTFKLIMFKPFLEHVIHQLGANKQNRIKSKTRVFKTIFKYFLLPKTLSSLMFLIQNHSPAGKVHTRICRSKKKETHVVGWCSDTEAMIGMWIFAYLF